jgi:exosortase
LTAAPVGYFLAVAWTRSIWENGHGLFTPFVVVALAYRALRNEPVKDEAPSLWGFLVLAPALFLVWVDSVVKTDFLRAFGLVLCLPGLSLLLLGRRRTRALRFPLFLSFFMLPFPPGLLATLQEPLQLFTTAGSGWFLRFLGQPAFVEGTQLHMPHGTFLVVQQCSGFSALYAAITVSLILAHLSRSTLHRLVLVLVAVPLALAGNVLRVGVLGLLAEWRGYEILATPIHSISGYASFLLALGVLFLLAEYRPRSAST